MARLGEQTRIAAEVNGEPGFWVSFRLNPRDADEYWLVLPRERASRNFAARWLSWVVLAVGLALVVAWLIASRISRPLKAFCPFGANPWPLSDAEPLRKKVQKKYAPGHGIQHHAHDLARPKKTAPKYCRHLHDLRTRSPGWPEIEMGVTTPRPTGG